MSSESEDYQRALGPFAIDALILAHLLISGYNKSDEDPFWFGSYEGAIRTREINLLETGKQRLVSQLQDRIERLIDAAHISVASPLYIHWMDVKALSQVFMGQHDLASNTLEKLSSIGPKTFTSPGIYLSSRHNAALLLHIVHDSGAENAYLRVLDDQRTYSGQTSLITLENLSSLLDDPAVVSHLYAVSRYGIREKSHSPEGRRIAQNLLGFTDTELMQMS